MLIKCHLTRLTKQTYSWKMLYSSLWIAEVIAKSFSEGLRTVVKLIGGIDGALLGFWKKIKLEYVKLLLLLLSSPAVLEISNVSETQRFSEELHPLVSHMLIKCLILVIWFYFTGNSKIIFVTNLVRSKCWEFSCFVIWTEDFVTAKLISLEATALTRRRKFLG